MGQIRSHPPVKLIVGIIMAIPDLLTVVHQRLSEQFGRVDFASDLLPFDYTNYYEAEMGKDLKRQFVSLRDLFPLRNSHPPSTFLMQLNANSQRVIRLSVRLISIRAIFQRQSWFLLQRKTMPTASISKITFTPKLRSNFTVRPSSLGNGLTLITVHPHTLLSSTISAVTTWNN